jgi:hypothetical protein
MSRTSVPRPSGIFSGSARNERSFQKKMLPGVASCQPASMIRKPIGKPDSRKARAAPRRFPVVCFS